MCQSTSLAKMKVDVVNLHCLTQTFAAARMCRYCLLNLEAPLRSE